MNQCEECTYYAYDEEYDEYMPKGIFCIGEADFHCGVRVAIQRTGFALNCNTDP